MKSYNVTSKGYSGDSGKDGIDPFGEINDYQGLIPAVGESLASPIRNSYASSGKQNVRLLSLKELGGNLKPSNLSDDNNIARYSSQPSIISVSNFTSFTSGEISSQENPIIGNAVSTTLKSLGLNNSEPSTIENESPSVESLRNSQVVFASSSNEANINSNYSTPTKTETFPDSSNSTTSITTNDTNNLFLSNSNRGSSQPSAQTPLEIALSFLRENAQDFALTAASVENLIVTDQYVSEHNGATHIYFAQQFNGLEVFNGDLNLTITADDQVVSIGNRSAQSPVQQFNNTQPRLSAAEAVEAAAARVGLTFDSPMNLVENIGGVAQEVTFAGGNVSHDDIPAQLMYQIGNDGQAHLVWHTVINSTNSSDWWEMTIDASTGRVLEQVNWTFHADYNVFDHPLEHPNDGPRTIVTDVHDPIASPFGWHDTNGVNGAEFTDTRGNNVFAQEDRDANNTGGYRPDGGTDLIFDFPLDLALDPIDYEDASITNLFYWNNVLHDIYFHYGFDEAAGNFQFTNYSGNGLGGDPVQADAQDGSGFNNANFATPPDGIAPRMQMFIWDWTTPRRDSSFDNGIIIHEYGHGVSNRLTGGASNSAALNATQSGAMGEGWSDFWAIALTMKDTDTSSDSYGVGTYVLGQPPDGPGIRNFPYSTDLSVNPLTYEDIKTLNLPHGGGEIWAVTLLDLYWNFVDQYGFDSDIYNGTGGNNMVMQLVMDGLKIQSANPSYLEARDAILAADLLNNGGANQELIWETFARRGMGVSANDGGNANSLNVTNGFDALTSSGIVTLNSELYELGDNISISVSDLDLAGTGSLSIALTSSDGDSETISLTESGTILGLFEGSILSAGGGITAGDGTLQVANGSTITVTYNDLDDGTGNPALVTDTAQVVTFVDIFNADFSDNSGNPSLDGFTIDNTGAPVSGLWHLSTGRGNQPNHSADDSIYFGQNEGPNGGGNYDVGHTAGRIISPFIDLTSAPTAQLSFNYFLETEGSSFFDQAQVLVSDDGGVTFNPIASNPGELVDPTTGWTNATFDLTPFVGNTIQLQFDFNTGDGIANNFEGWYIDDVIVQAPGTPLGEIHGSKWNDIDGDGVRDAGELGLQGWTIYLDQNNNGQLDNGELSTVTDANGDYWFTDLAPDTYTVAEVLLPGWEQTFPSDTSGNETTIIDFESLEHEDGNIADHGFSYEEDGFVLENLSNQFEFASFGTLHPNFSGSTALYNNTINGISRLTSLDGQPFDLMSIDLTELNGSSVADVTFTGELSGGGTVTQTFTIDGISFDPETFVFSGFNDVIAVEWSQVSPFHQFDNITITTDQNTIPGTHTVELDPGEIVNDIDFGNQQIPSSTIFGTLGPDELNIFESPVIVFAGGSNDIVDGSQSPGGNRYYGGDRDDIIWASVYDRLFGEDGNDTLFAGDGNSILHGGADADQFWIALAALPSAANTIADFEEGVDLIGIGGLGISFGDLNITQNGDDAIINALGTDLAILTEIQATALDSTSFVFA